MNEDGSCEGDNKYWRGGKLLEGRWRQLQSRPVMVGFNENWGG